MGLWPVALSDGVPPPPVTASPTLEELTVLGQVASGNQITGTVLGRAAAPWKHPESGPGPPPPHQPRAPEAEAGRSGDGGPSHAAAPAAPAASQPQVLG